MGVRVMDFVEIDRIINDHGFASEPAFTDVYISVHEIPPEMNAIGLYYPDSEVIVIPPDGLESVLLHELGHRYGHFYFEDLTEQYAEAFRRRYETRHLAPLGKDVSYLPYSRPANAVVYQIAPTDSPLLPIFCIGLALGAGVLLDKSRRR
jgi:hypothetical protein